MPSGEARGAAAAICYILRTEVSSICSLLSSSSEVRGDPMVAVSNCPNGLLSRVQARTMGGRVSKHLLPSPRMAAAHRLLLLLTLVLPWNRSGGLGNSNSNLRGLAIHREDHPPRRCGTSNKNKLYTKVCMTERKNSGRRASLLHHAVTYGGKHRLLHPVPAFKCCGTVEGHGGGLPSIGEAFLARRETA